jgi:tripartite-type tricarboxylate transporter receptor subunit TctC
MQAPGIMFKAAEFGWVGRATNITEIMMTWHTSKTKSFDDALVHETPIGTTGPGSPSESYPKLLNGLRKSKFKIIGGYPASANALLATEKGEIDAAFTSWDTLKASKRDWIEQKRVNILVQFNTKRLAELPDVPSGVELAVTDEDRKILEFFISGSEVGRSFLTTPGVPAERLKLLRTAFMAMARDEEFRSDLARSKADLNPMAGEEVQEMIQAVTRTPRAVIARMQAVLTEAK